ncbi:ubiquitin-conjugating enzyme E2Q-like protein 1 isoform X2 [Halichondria panicea]|uniref:ubiquitin-conjugating enzyme E2Q-like protein 1 isoform X2 n=1 Tax=Halichondria panicea TaxID=6063 RepID=UPI00312BCB7C
MGTPTRHMTGVWSDNDSCIPLLSVEMDYLSSASRSLTQVLERAASCLEAGQVSDEEGDYLDSDEDFDDYYANDVDDIATPSPSVEQTVSADDFFTGQGTPSAVHRLLADLKGLNKSSGEFGITGKPQGDNLFVWGVELSDFPKDTPLAEDLEAYAKNSNRKPVVELEMKFPKDYPMNPPFVRILRPRFKFLTGHVTVGGSICMQMLTRSGWTPSNDIESILVQIRSEIISDPNTRLDSGRPDVEYSESEATVAFERMVHKYGWNR